jgi:hypothetical protein
LNDPKFRNHSRDRVSPRVVGGDGTTLHKVNRDSAWRWMITVTKMANSAESMAIPSSARFGVITVQILPQDAPRAIDLRMPWTNWTEASLNNLAPDYEASKLAQIFPT